MSRNIKGATRSILLGRPGQNHRLAAGIAETLSSELQAQLYMVLMAYEDELHQLKRRSHPGWPPGRR